MKIESGNASQPSCLTNALINLFQANVEIGMVANCEAGEK